MLAKVDREVMNAAIERLPVKFREVLLLREFEDLSYKEIAIIAEVPVGTVMSRWPGCLKRCRRSRWKRERAPTRHSFGHLDR
jgi:RNA polymerase sigma factor (sigma-70 family)